MGDVRGIPWELGPRERMQNRTRDQPTGTPAAATSLGLPAPQADVGMMEACCVALRSQTQEVYVLTPRKQATAQVGYESMGCLCRPGWSLSSLRDCA